MHLWSTCMIINKIQEYIQDVILQYSDNLVQDIDLIILGGYYGQSKYTGMIKSFMMGVAAPASNEGENPSQFLSIVSVSTGIGDQMLRHLQTKLAPYWIKEHPENITGPRVNTYYYFRRVYMYIFLSICYLHIYYLIYYT